MRFSDISFFFKEAFIGIYRSKLMFSISILTVSICLFLLGVFVFINQNLSNLSNDMIDKLEVKVFFKHEANALDLKELIANINNVKGVKQTIFVDRKSAWESFKDRHQQIPLAYYNFQHLHKLYNT